MSIFITGIIASKVRQASTPPDASASITARSALLSYGGDQRSRVPFEPT
jgi:hypothetical protein